MKVRSNVHFTAPSFLPHCSMTKTRAVIDHCDEKRIFCDFIISSFYKRILKTKCWQYVLDRSWMMDIPLFLSIYVVGGQCSKRAQPVPSKFLIPPTAFPKIKDLDMVNLIGCKPLLVISERLWTQAVTTTAFRDRSIKLQLSCKKQSNLLTSLTSICFVAFASTTAQWVNNNLGRPVKGVLFFNWFVWINELRWLRHFRNSKYAQGILHQQCRGI